MIKKINDFLAGWLMTVVGGIFLIASFILPRTGYPAGENLAWVCVIICGIPLLYLSIWRIIYNKGISKISSALLISLAMIAAIMIGDLFAAGEVAFIMEIGALLEDMTTERAKKGLKNLIALTPEQGRVIRDGKEVMIPASEIRPGDLLRVLPGETIPVDGIIQTGETSVDQSVMTGESLPVDKTPGDSVFSGTINRFGSIDFEAVRTGSDSSLQKLIRMVEDAEKNQAPTQRIADKWASWLVPVALLIAIAAYVFTGNIVRAVTVMVVFCPCALVLATPTAIMAAIGQAAKHGVIIKSGEALEKMGKADTIAFDKTGTLTIGSLTVSDIISFTDMSEEELLVLAASAESRSEHPLGKAITEKAKNDSLSLSETKDFRMTAGKGISASINDKTYHLGNEKYINEYGVTQTKETAEALNRLSEEGKASVIISDGKNIIGIIALSDIIRPEAADIIRQLSAMHTKTVLLTGDNNKAASYLAERAGIQEVSADLLPSQKVECINELKQHGTVCMIGDGVNDAPALKTADVGIAMGVMGSDIAVEAADIALMTDDISRLPYLKWLSNTTVKTIRTAITLSMCINFIAVTLSVLGKLTPTTGALVHNAGSCFVVLLAALLYDRKYNPAKL
ncbi:MAG TPA: heavy metal translocating P-type ATPase [Erysipelotrichaceae bacterium]|nr:heavy metal translocating P-type ATPase [Erysipelotrichaceae bacterium]